MTGSRPATRRQLIGFGTLFTGTGLYIMLVGAGVEPVPGGPANLHAPLWVAFLAGLPFFCAGIAILLQTLGGADAKGKLPPDAPAWMHALQRLTVLVILAAFAVLATWVALAGDPDQFSGSFIGFGVSIARIAFGFGALVCWVGTIGLAVSMVRKLFAARV